MTERNDLLFDKSLDRVWDEAKNSTDIVHLRALTRHNIAMIKNLDKRVQELEEKVDEEN